MRQGKHVMEIRHREELLLASGGPGGRIRALALGAVAVAATVVGVLLETARLAALMLPTQRGRAAMCDRPQGLPLSRAQWMRPLIRCAILGKNVGQLAGSTLHRRPWEGAVGDMALLLKILVLGTSQQFQRALHATQLLAGHVQILRCRAQASVAHQTLDDWQGHTGFHQVSCERMTQTMNPVAMLDARCVPWPDRRPFGRWPPTGGSRPAPLQTARSGAGRHANRPAVPPAVAVRARCSDPCALCLDRCA